MKKVLMLLCAACLLTAGCLDSLPFIGEDDDVVVTVSAMSSDEVDTLLNDVATMDIAALAEAEEQFRAEIYSKGIEDGEVLEMTIVLVKDEVSQLSEVGIEFQSGMMGIEYSIVQGASTDVNIRVGNQWFLARDAAPEYVDPFTDTGEEEEDEGDDSSGDDFTDEFEELLPDFDDISFDTEGFDWVVTIDQMSLQQVATGSNDTHEIMVEFLEMPPRLHSLEVLSANGSEAMSVTLDWGEEVALELRTDVPRTSVMFEIDEGVDFEEVEDDSFVWICGDGIELSPELVLDGTVDCADSSDEEAMYQCVNGDYILFSWLNDDEIDCSDGSDEDDGSDTYVFMCADGTTISLSWGNDGMYDCDDDSDEDFFECDDGNNILFIYLLDGDEDCWDGSDEIPSIELVTFSGEISEDHDQEVNITDMELRIGETDDDDEFVYELSMMLSLGSANLTDSDGTWWSIVWDDADGDGLVSSGDTYAVLTNNGSAWDMEIRFYDHWAEAYEGGPLPGFDLVFLLVALAFAAVRRKTFLL